MAVKSREGRGRRSIGFFVIIVILGALIGSVIGELVGHFFSKGALLYKIFTTGISPGLDIPEIDLAVINFKFAMSVKLNVCSALGMIMAGYLYRYL